MQDGQVMIHVRFSPDGTVTQIGERPDWATAQAWFDRLSCKVGANYQPLSGGRGLFRMARGEIDALKVATT